MEYVRYGGHTSCVAIAHDGADAPSLILDAGVGLMQAAKLLDGGPFIGTIMLTHLHWDHVTGLPFFGAGDRPDSHLHVVVPAQDGGESAVEILSGIMRPPYFPVGPTGLRGDWSFSTIAPGTHTVEGFEVLALEVPHKGGRTLGFRISDGSSTMTYMPDHCPTAIGPGDDGLGAYHEVALALVGYGDEDDSETLPAAEDAEA